MRILHLSALPVWSMEGKAGMPSLHETLQGHIRAGHSVVLVMPRYNLSEDTGTPVSVPVGDGYEVHVARCTWAPIFFRVRRVLRRLASGDELPFVFRWLLNVSKCLLLTAGLMSIVLRLRFREKLQVDLVYAHNKYGALAGWLSGRLLRVPNVTRLYGTGLAAALGKPLVALRYPVAVAAFRIPHSLLICVNDGSRADIVARKLGVDPHRFRFWQNGVDPPNWSASASRDDFIERFPSKNLRRDSKWVIACARLNHLKRVDRVVYAVKIARDRGADCQLVVAGDGPDRSKLANLVEDLGISKEVVWLGAVPHDDVWSVMRSGDVFVINNDHSNRCNPLYEAICAGLPVVSARDPLTADLLEEEGNALLAEKDDLESLGCSIYRICTDEELAANMRVAQRQRASQLWSWRERMAEEVRELEALVGNYKVVAAAV